MAATRSAVLSCLVTRDMKHRMRPRTGTTIAEAASPYMPRPRDWQA